MAVIVRVAHVDRFRLILPRTLQKIALTSQPARNVSAPRKLVLYQTN
jgi:hypothetical protein